MSETSGLRASMNAARQRLRERLRLYSDDMMISGVILIVLIAFMLPSMVVTIPAGHLGVMWKRFAGGTVTDHVVHEGTSVILPWDKIFIYDARLQSVDREFEVLSSDGLKLKVDLAWRFRVIPAVLGKLHQYAGIDYPETLLAPSVGARARDVIAIYRPEDIYTDHRLEIQHQISESVRYDLKNRFSAEGVEGKEWVIIEDVLIKRIVLPEGVQESIVRKNMARHEVEQYSLIVQKELKETERKRVEALGIRNFQEIVSSGMTESYLRWRGIEATLELARSNNAKVVVVGNSKTGGLPLIAISGDAPKLEDPSVHSSGSITQRPGTGQAHASNMERSGDPKPVEGKASNTKTNDVNPKDAKLADAKTGDANLKESRVAADKTARSNMPGAR